MRPLIIFSLGLTWLLQVVPLTAASQVLDYNNFSLTSSNVSPTTAQESYSAWIGLELVPPLPQCIAQQPHATWLDTMVPCISRACTRHFGVICTRHEWRFRPECLSESFGPAVVAPYYDICNRSVLAKAQLYSWIRKITARNWLVNVGDTVDVQSLSPSSLALGFETTDVSNVAPQCFRTSHLGANQESFENVLALCSFTAAAQHVGNAGRSWEYNEGSHSVLALSFETASYEVTKQHIPESIYFDKQCFCDTMAPDIGDGTCPNGEGQLDYTREVLWIHALCGAKYLPRNWTSEIKTTEYKYIPRPDFKWPVCVNDFPVRTLELKDRCASEACAIDAQGYCKPVPAIERACVCQNIRYKSATGSCHEFEGRIDYVNWLHDLCGKEEGWDGLPHGWQNLAVPTSEDLIPWNWTVTPHWSLKDVSSDERSTPRLRQDECPSAIWKFANLAAINVILVLTIILINKSALHQTSLKPLRSMVPRTWYKNAFVMIALSLLANWLNALSVQYTPGYGYTQISQLMLLWSTIPKPTWLPILLLGTNSAEDFDITAAMAFVCSEIILGCLSAWYMSVSVFYGLQHNFYFGRLTEVDNGGWAVIMYIGAALWMFIAVAALVKLIGSSANVKAQTLRAQVDDLRDHWEDRCKWIDAQIFEQLTGQHYKSDRSPLNEGNPRFEQSYGTLPLTNQVEWRGGERPASVYSTVLTTLVSAWIAQSLFWTGFIGLSGNAYCPPALGALSMVWVGAAILGLVVGLA